MIRLSIRRPVAITMAYFGVALLGVAAWRNIPIELLPDTDLPQLTVEANWRGASPEAMEAFVTSPMESAIQQVRGVEKITSISAEQYGSATAQIQVEFERDTDMDFARLDLSERLTVLEDELPAGVQPPRVTPYVPSELRDQTTPFFRYEVTGPYTQEALRAHVDDRVVPELLLVEGVATVDVRGGRERVLQIEMDERKINALGLNVWYVRQRISELEYVAEAGAVEVDGLLRTVAIRHNTESADEIRRTPLLTDQGRIVRVEDVARVHDTFEDPTSYNRINAQPAISFRVYKEIGVNTVQVADLVKARMAEIANIHPTGVELILDQDESEDIKKQLQDLRIRALIAAGVIFLVLLVFLRSFRSAAIVFMTIAFSILIALNLIYFGGFTLNVLTLMGLAMGFGLIVDNAIVVLENIYRKRQRGEEPEIAAEHGAKEVVLPILAATLTTVIVFIPFVYLQGELRVFYVPLAIVVGMSLVASLFVAFSFIPGLASKVLGGKAVKRFGGMQTTEPASPDSIAGSAISQSYRDTIQRSPIYVRFYAAILGFTLRLTKRRNFPVLPLATVAMAVLAFGTSYYVFNKYVNRGVLWGSWGGSDTYIDIRIRLPRGAELERVDELTRFFEDKLKTMPEIDQFTAYVQPEYARMRVTFPDSLETTMVPVAIKEQLLAYSYLFGGAEVRVYGYGPSFYGGGGGSPNYTIKVLGYNYEKVREIAEHLGGRLERFSRVRDVDVNSIGYYISSRDKVIEFALAIDRQRLGLHGITTLDVVYQVLSAVPGQSTTDRIRIDGEEVWYEVKLEGYEEFDVLQLEELLLRAPTGEGVRLGDVATLVERQVLNRVVREDQQYQRNVSYEFRGPSKLGDQVQEVVMNATAIPDGYRIEGRDEWRWDWEEEKQIWAVLAIALVLVFMVTAALFESLRQPLCVLLTVPMALIGVFLMFFYAEASFTREAYIGVIMMGGIVVNNAILLVDHVNHLRRNEGLALQEATLRGTLERVRPILMTSTTTIFGLLPLVLFSEYADANIWNALGYALIGGLASSTILVLTVTPALYLMFELRPERRRVIAAKPVEAEAMA
jgi:HAE1 family hydrophobic/amphiphilic exporter-1